MSLWGYKVAKMSKKVLNKSLGDIIESQQKVAELPPTPVVPMDDVTPLVNAINNLGNKLPINLPTPVVTVEPPVVNIKAHRLQHDYLCALLTSIDGNSAHDKLLDKLVEVSFEIEAKVISKYAKEK